MFILYALAIGLLVGWLSGGHFERLAHLQIRWTALIVAGLGAQVVLFAEPVARRLEDLGPALYVASTTAVVVAVVRNVSIAGMPLVAAGALSNLAAVIANGGFMPASQAALAAAGRVTPTIYSNSVAARSPELWPLTDIFALPAAMPLANVFSVGDVMIGLGIALVAILGMRANSPATGTA
jgi:Family of unknown function (DUF5317)